MAELRLSPFRTTRIVQSQIQEFLDAVSMAILAYQEGMIAYLIVQNVFEQEVFVVSSASYIENKP
jgi:hypothetical protein